MVFLTLFILPIVFIVWQIMLFFTKKRTGVGSALGFFVLAVATGFWAIIQSRSSTAGIGIIFLPSFGAAAGALGWGFGKLRTADKKSHRLWSYVCLLGAIFIVGSSIHGGLKTIELNKNRDAEWHAHELKMAENKNLIRAAMQNNPGRESATLDKLVTDHLDDRYFLIPALENKFISADTVDRLASHPDLVLSVLRSPNIKVETLVRIYRTSNNLDYLGADFAGNPRTPPDILHEIYNRPDTMGRWDIWFAENPSTPRDILDSIASRTTDINVLRGFLHNPKTDCALIHKLEGPLKAGSQPGDSTMSWLNDIKQERCG